jgi:uncharacterized protein (DUF433 family)
MSPHLAFTTDEVTCLTGLSSRTLRSWEESGISQASYIDERPHRPYRRLYTLLEVVSLRTLATLRRPHRVGVDGLRTVGAFLMRHRGTPVSSLRVQKEGQRVASVDAVKAPTAEDGLTHQGVSFDLDEMAHLIRMEAARLRERQPEDFGRVTRHRYVFHNAWVVAGTRIPTSAIIDFSEAGYSPEEIIREYPALRPVDVTAAIAHERQFRERIAA